MNPEAGVPRAAVQPPGRGPRLSEPDPPPAVPQATPPPDHSKELERLAAEIGRFLQDHRSVVSITMDSELQQIVTKVLTEDSGEVIRQYPPEAIIAVMKRMRELRGILLHRKG